MATKTSSAGTGAAPGAERGHPPRVRFRMRISDQQSVAVGPGKIDLLEALERSGSITAAAKSMDMSYRRAWVLLDEINRALREPAVKSTKGGASGGRSELTEAGRKVIALYRKIEKDAEAACRRDIKALVGLLSR